MIHNYFIVGFRNLIRNKVFSIINIVGLAVGLACAILILLWIEDEVSIDSFHANTDNLYSVYERVYNEGKVNASYFTQGLLAEELKQTIPEIEYASSFWALDPTTFELGNKILKMEGASAGEDFFKMFSYQLLEGNVETALSDPSHIAISRKMAEAFFGDVSAAVGQTIRFENRKDLLISAVFENVPKNSSEKFDFLCNWRWRLEEVAWLKQWIYRAPRTYILLHPSVKAEALESKIKNFVTPYLEASASSFRMELGLQRFDKKYLYSSFNNGIPDGGGIEYVKLFAFVAVFILFIACINFMNLSTSRYIKRSKEVGIRKAVGAVRSSITIQFLIEAILLTIFAVCISLILITSLLPLFNSITDKEILFPFYNFNFWAIIICLTIVTGLVAGSYPALFLSSLHPIKILKGSVKFSSRISFFRKGLVVFQFILSVIIISCAIIVSKQVNFIQTKSLGFDKENLIYIPFQGDLAYKYDVFEQKILNTSGVKNITRSVQRPTQTSLHVYNLDWSGKNPDTRGVAVHNGVGYNFLSVMNLKLLQGRNFSEDVLSDSTGYIINEAALKMMGHKDPIGQPLTFFEHTGRIIGVVEDFHLTSLYAPIEPLVMFLFEEDIATGYALVKIEPHKTQETIKEIEKIYREMEPNFLFTYQFSTDHQATLYKNEKVAKSLSDCFAVVSIIISCLGLYGLSMFTLEQRTKEIGIRKVLGASGSHIFSILSSDFVKLVLLSIIIAMPLAYFIMQSWLAKYAYRTDMELMYFIIPALVILLLTLFTVSFHVLKAANTNTVEALKYE